MKPLTIYSFGYYFYVFILYTFMSILAYIKNDYVLSFTSMKLIFTTLMGSFNLFIICYFYNHLENEINRVQFVLYNIDWTGKSIAFKKMLLLTMNLNNTSRLRMNITPQKSLNLEVFGSAMRMSYSIISLFAKKTNSK